MSRARYPRDLLVRTAAVSSSMVDLMRRLEAPLGSIARRYLHYRLEHYGIDTSHFVDEPLPKRAKRTYSKAVLEEAAAHSDSIRGVIEYLGYPPSDSPYGHVRKKLDQYGIDTSHFIRRSGDGLFPREQLADAVAKSYSLAGVLRSLGHCNSGAARVRLQRSIAEYGLSTDHFMGQGHQAGQRSPTRKTPEEVLVRGSGGTRRTKTAMLRRALDDLDVPRVCVACGTGDVWQGKRLVLEIDHINGDRWDNRRENLRYLCPSCHSQTRTFSNRSRLTSADQRPVQ
ncbi:HNH endonuclease [Streptomyces sp. CB03234]|uniref:HNH endonuclease signature motif containing protein n=1 Tax=Streptomyces sp. (strain CB03234) TaxID=1703937 RepID=UPI00093AF594|nr:HNH endonuclease [Streptomyces sp. CB03234]OKK07643.1 HNH endonuclease [Streptomyces sp. CB03234]